MNGRTTAQVAAAMGRSRETALVILLDEERRGDVERVGPELWRLTATFDAEYGAAFRDLPELAEREEAAAA